ncbi:hypothetical protein SAMN05421736_10757 [Evansella caseinilytica]|uniref:Uncharacterized protein n=1 Tax=Evansella caseinilytica TaxID=1503961 RepID=A0A1H3QUX0_9BACI|nr:hypothetical protein [Evansella caseinilytica]SDZ17053.1 hypothetical protein SAMN05421736_10757 [Evansella caseinilytica]
MDTKSTGKNGRYYRAHVSSFNTNVLYLKTPWIPAWWSAAFPGAGHIIHGSYAKGFILFLWEFYVNVNAKINAAMVYSFTGQFEQAAEVINPQWALLYIPVYIASIWDSYRKTVDINKLYILAQHEKIPIVPYNLSSLALNFLDRRQPRLAAIWSALMPGMGHLYLKRLPVGFFLLVCWMVCSYYGNLLPAIHLLLIGNFKESISTLNIQWVLFMPSLYGFSIYESYVLAVEYNKLFKQEQYDFFKNNYQSLPLKLRKYT